MPFDYDYLFDVMRDDEALYCKGEGQVHAEFDSRETVNQWDNTGTWWEKFHKAKDNQGDEEVRGRVDGHFAIVIGMLNLDSSHRGKSELHPVYAMFVLVDWNRRLRQSSWAFFVRNWGNEGSCGSRSPNLYSAFIKVQIPRALGIVASNIWEGSRKTRDFSSMDFSAQPNEGGMELRFVLLKPERESWIMGDITFQDVVSVTADARDAMLPHPRTRRSATAREEKDTHPQFEAVLAQIDRLPERSRKELLARLESVVLKKEGRRRSVRVIAQATRGGETRPKSPGAVVRQSNLVRLEKDSVGELNRRKQLEVLRSFFAERGVHIDLPPGY